MANRPFNPLHRVVFPQDFKRFRPEGFAGVGEADQIHEPAGFRAESEQSRRFRRLNVLDAGDVKNGTPSGI